MGPMEPGRRPFGLGEIHKKNGIETCGLGASRLDSALHTVNLSNYTLIMIANPLPRASNYLLSRHRDQVPTPSQPDLCAITTLHIRPPTFWMPTAPGRAWP